MNQDPLANLRDLHYPAEIGWWPPAIGWWLLLLLVIAAIAVAVWLYRKRVAKQKIQQAIDDELEQLLAQYKAEGNFQQYLQQLSELLKRAAISLRGDTHVASYTGERWQDYINQKSPEGQAELSNYFGDKLYRAKGSGDVTALQHFARKWLINLAEAKHD